MELLKDTKDLYFAKNIEKQLIESERIPSDVEGGYYKIEIYRIIDECGNIYHDEVFHAPWQVGGNSGQVRPLKFIGNIND